MFYFIHDWWLVFLPSEFTFLCHVVLVPPFPSCHHHWLSNFISLSIHYTFCSLHAYPILLFLIIHLPFYLQSPNSSYHSISFCLCCSATESYVRIPEQWVVLPADDSPTTEHNLIFPCTGLIHKHRIFHNRELVCDFLATCYWLHCKFSTLLSVPLLCATPKTHTWELLCDFLATHYLLHSASKCPLNYQFPCTVPLLTDTLLSPTGALYIIPQHTLPHTTGCTILLEHPANHPFPCTAPLSKDA